ncbi:hypothetical protein [Micromonospora sp. NPDC007230]|uniref:hypothetical protein n=1 Tax=Micromonospora sp. NPDC007230 TaxID=3364237 RepID=UPI0036CF71FF
MIPRGLVCDLPVLILSGASFTYEAGTFYVDLRFRPCPGTHHEMSLCFSGSWFDAVDEPDLPSEERRYRAWYGATVGSTGNWVDGGGVAFCGMSRGVLYLEWLPTAAAELGLPQFTVIELHVDNNTVEELRTALRSLFDWNMPDGPRLELARPTGPAVEQLELWLP